MRVSVVSSTFNRAELLDRALYTYSKQTLPFDQWEYLIADDGSQDNTKEVILNWQQRGLPVHYFDAARDLDLPKEPGKWRDGCKVRNRLSTFATGRVLVMTHPEIMILPETLEAMAETVEARPDAWVTAIPYWLPPTKMTSWRRDLMRLREMEDFYHPDWPPAPGAINYENSNQERRQEWESEVFWGMAMSLWRWLGGFREFEVWGSVDMDFWSRRQVAGIPTVILKDPLNRVPSGNMMVFHQPHDASHANMDAAMSALAGADYSTVESMRQHGGLYGHYYTGPRERARDGRLDGILHDHIARYQFAAELAAGRDVLDVGCGTGYGALVLGPFASYLGIDVDEESIEWARKHYPGNFEVASATAIPRPAESFDLVLAFEVIEHVADQKTMVAEMHRVLRPDSWLILSTPQDGAVVPLCWDRHRLTWEMLLALFPEEEWEIEYYHQDYYGFTPVTPGPPGPRSEVMIIKGRKR